MYKITLSPKHTQRDFPLVTMLFELWARDCDAGPQLFKQHCHNRRVGRRAGRRAGNRVGVFRALSVNFKHLYVCQKCFGFQ